MKKVQRDSKQSTRPKSSSYAVYLKKNSGSSASKSHYHNVSHHDNIPVHQTSKSKERYGKTSLNYKIHEGSLYKPTVYKRQKLSKSQKELNNSHINHNSHGIAKQNLNLSSYPEPQLLERADWKDVILHSIQKKQKNPTFDGKRQISVRHQRKRQSLLKEHQTKEGQIKDRKIWEREKIFHKEKFMHQSVPHHRSNDNINQRSMKSIQKDICTVADRYKIIYSKPAKKGGVKSLQPKSNSTKPRFNQQNKSANNLNALQSLSDSLFKKQQRCKSALGKNSTMPQQSQNQCGSHIGSAYQTLSDQRQGQSKESMENVRFNYSYRTRKGSLYSNPNKPNQDSFVAKKGMIADEDAHVHFFCVADGHGTHGHHVSQTITENIVQLLHIQLRGEKSSPQKALYIAYDQLQSILTENKKQINIQCSGSTLVSILLLGKQLTCANVGDSRAILARQIDKKCWEMIYLSEDHKPSVQKQKKRILKHGGRVHAFKDQNGSYVGPLRVWLPSKNMQGLAMSRSLGDNISKSIGVTHQPELIKVSLEPRDKFLLLASDGVWEFLTNQQVLQLIVPYYKQNKLEEACDALLKLAQQRWTVDDASVIDDITFILIFLWK